MGRSLSLGIDGVDSEADQGCLAVFPLRGDRVILRPLGPEHLDALCTGANNRRVSETVSRLPYPYRRQDGEVFLRDTAQCHAQGDGLRLAIERAGDGAFLGVTGFNLAPDGSLETGYWLCEEHWGQGYGSDAIRQLMAHGIETLGYQQVFAHVLEQNIASQKILLKSGFVAEGIEDQPFPLRPEGTAPCRRFTLTAEAFAEVRKSRLLLVTAVALLDSDNRVLLQQRPLDKHMGGLWEFPGGKVDPGETPERALVRELNEELGIDVRESCLAPLTFASHAYDGFHLLMPLYICRNWKGRIEGREGQKVAWVSAAKLADYPMPPADIPLIPILRDWL
jgi:8-oxo-dGTP diphosphatase